MLKKFIERVENSVLLEMVEDFVLDGGFQREYDKIKDKVHSKCQKQKDSDKMKGDNHADSHNGGDSQVNDAQVKREEAVGREEKESTALVKVN
jgi:hypothetical protein